MNRNLLTQKEQPVGNAAKNGDEATNSSPFLYVYRWDRPAGASRKGQRCRMLTRSVAQNSCLLEFEDGFKLVTSRNAVKRADNEKISRTVRTEVVKIKSSVRAAEEINHENPVRQ